MEGTVHSLDHQKFKFEGTLRELLCKADERPTTSLAKFLQAKSNSPDYAEALEGRMAENVDSTLRAQYQLSERERPRPQAVVKALAVQQRADLLMWIMQAFSALGLDEAMVHGVALNIDRLMATSQGAEKLPHNCIPTIVLAVVCTELKTDGFNDCPGREWKQVLAHMSRLGGGQVPMLQILRVEMQILNRLRYVVGLPTPLSFLTSLTQHLRQEPEAGRWISLAKFLLELGMLEPMIQHSFPHAILAAGALAASLRVLDAPDAKRQELLEDLTIWPAETDLLWVCEEELLQLWLRSKDGMVEFHRAFRWLEVKYSSPSKFEVAYLSPLGALSALTEERAEREPVFRDWPYWEITGGLRQCDPVA